MVKTRAIRLRVKEGPKRVIKLRYVHSIHSLSRSPSEFWLHTCDACVITTWRLALWAPLVARNNNINIYENNDNLKGYKIYKTIIKIFISRNVSVRSTQATPSRIPRT